MLDRVARPALLLAVALAIAGGAFLFGRATATQSTPPGGYYAGREDAFSGFDGGWVLGDPYIVTLRHGGPGVTYQFARRWPLLPGREYRICDQDIICSRPAAP